MTVRVFMELDRGEDRAEDEGNNVNIEAPVVFTSDEVYIDGVFDQATGDTVETSREEDALILHRAHEIERTMR